MTDSVNESPTPKQASNNDNTPHKAEDKATGQPEPIITDYASL